MPLPIEVNHVLGRRSLTLAYRDADAPVTVGRSRECDVQIPSVAIGATHCMLFVHEGQWLLQESPDCVVTVNGQQIAGPVALQIGDVIGIGTGAKAPTIQIDPAGAAAGKTGPAVETTPAPAAGSPISPAVIGGAGARSVRPPKPTPVAGEAPPQLSPAPPARPKEPQPPSVPEEYSHADEPPAQEYAEAAVGEHADLHSDAIDLDPSLTSAASSYYRPRRPKKDSGAGGMVMLFLAVIGGLGILIYWAWTRYQANLAANQPTPPPVVVATPPMTEPATQPMIEDTGGPNNSIFDVPGSKSKHHPTPPAAADPGAAVTPVPPPPAPPAPDPGSTTAPATEAAEVPDDDTDADWLAVLTAHSSPDQANAIIKYDSYRQQNGDKHAAQLAQFEADAAEELWWQRVLDLFNRRADLDKQMADKRTDITDQPPGDFHNQLVAELKDLQDKRDAADQKLTVDFAYTLATPPDIDDRATIAQLDAKRDPVKFEQWKKNTLTWIREHNGRPPWADE